MKKRQLNTNDAQLCSICFVDLPGELSALDCI